MQRGSISARLTLAAAVLALFAGASRADYIGFSTSLTLNSVDPSGSTITGNKTPDVGIKTPDGTSITMLGLSSPDPINHIGVSGAGTDIIFGKITPNLLATTPNQQVNIGFTFNLTLTDFSVPVGGVETGAETIQITGTLSGTVGDGLKVNLNQIQNYVTSPADGLVQVGTGKYLVTLNPFIPPGPNQAGLFGAHIRVVPEPGSLVLLSLGGGLGLVGFLRRRRRIAG